MAMPSCLRRSEAGGGAGEVAPPGRRHARQEKGEVDLAPSRHWRRPDGDSDGSAGAAGRDLGDSGRRRAPAVREQGQTASSGRCIGNRRNVGSVMGQVDRCAHMSML